MGGSNSSIVRRVLVNIFGRSQSQSQSVNEGANGDELSYGQYEDGNRTEIMEEKSEENEAEEESQVDETNEDQRLTNVFWVHPRSIAAYEEFRDVVIIDITYLVNHYKMPFASIVGVNHQSQAIILGSALISHKDAKTFKWVFSAWLTAMGGRAPNAIMTDQCESMKSTIREVMPNTTHSRGRPQGSHFRSTFERRPNWGARGLGRAEGMAEVVDKLQIML
ncbi:hypothetical protein GH714_036435 [Hevea brasiliensis]|uniref:MULE transposase domain-containing protein n=1 Tax=Hevea brasiliensis TaxID=3981 RepID=A0A6A6LLZ5_HEVBR|nr:hypothetical protein GH714_036435 [Hevea brasiliensis]